MGPDTKFEQINLGLLINLSIDLYTNFKPRGLPKAVYSIIVVTLPRPSLVVTLPRPSHCYACLGDIET